MTDKLLLVSYRLTFHITSAELPPPPVDIQTTCNLVIWRNAPNISSDVIVGYEVRFVNPDRNEEVVKHLDASATFYSLDKLEDEVLQSVSTFVQVCLI